MKKTKMILKYLRNDNLNSLRKIINHTSAIELLLLAGNLPACEQAVIIKMLKGDF